MTVKLDADGTVILRDITNPENQDKRISVVSRTDGTPTTIWASSIVYPVVNGVLHIALNKQEATPVFALFLAKSFESRLKQVAETYNEKRAEYNRKVSYLPSSIPLPPEWFDASKCLEKAGKKGFDIKEMATAILLINLF
ncbi:MAG: hypothetical protein LBP26_01205 [Clostridiales bacterium]|nr:hypothetical protein [Clostridiales bacterium]